jgi:membrane dipeptidase
MMIPIIDIHADILMDIARHAEDEEEYVPRFLHHVARMKRGGVGGAVIVDCRMAGEPADPSHLETFISIVKKLRNAQGCGHYRLAASSKELADSFLSGTWTGLVCLEGLTAAGGRVEWISRLYREALLRIAALTHNDDNQFGGGALGSDPSKGLTQIGREAVVLMNQLGILIDMAHAGPITRREILECSTRPVMLSHTSSAYIYNNGRNLSDQEMRLIADHGGLVGCMTSPAALADIGDRAHHTIERYMEHLLHMLDAAGEDHVALGLHFCEYLYTREEYPPVRGLEDASRAQGILEALQQRGVPAAVIEKIAWRNFMRVFSEACG